MAGMIPRNLGKAGLALAAVAVLAAALALLYGVNSYVVYVLNLTLINAIAAIGLVVLAGVAGQISLGTAGLVAVGAYTTAITMNQLGLGFVPAALLGALAAALIGTALAAPALRLSGMHLAIVTLAFGIVVVQLIGKGGKLTGGMSGLFAPSVQIAGWAPDTEFKRLLLIVPPFLLVVYASRNFVALKTGRALLALRDREVVARTLGVDTSAYKVLTFAFSAFLCGISGALLVALKGYVSVDDFTLWNSLYFFVMIVIGGMTSVVGGIIGAAIVTVLPEVLRGFDESAQAILGVVTLVIFLALPGGIMGVLSRVLRRPTGFRWSARQRTEAGQ
jgi:ABC-type branched-subunit amino acid transport system permease subunit